MSLRLVIFDVDGTLVDSQGDIVASMDAAFVGVGLIPPSRAEILSIVGLSLDRAIHQLAPQTPVEMLKEMVARYKAEYQALRARAGAVSSPLYPGIRAVVDAFAGDDSTLLAIATGKSRRGLAALLDNHGWSRTFVSMQVADDHPSKPHPSMLLAALSDTGVSADRAVMIGDTTYDMDMAGAAGLPFLGVNWGYHAPAMLGDAVEILGAARDIPAAVSRVIGD